MDDVSARAKSKAGPRLAQSLRLPVFAAPMFLVSGPELVIAACKAGIVGAFPTPNCRSAAALDEWMAAITGALGEAGTQPSPHPIAPWALNLITHSSYPRLADDLALVKSHRPPIVITALGSPKPAIETVHGYGGLVFADVININLARKAAATGVDGLVCVAAGAGGHTGYFSPFAFISAVREFFDGMIVVGGGIADGAGIAGAIAAGADFAYMGTRFLATVESRAVASYKQMIVDCGPDDLVVSAAITGTAASWLKPSLIARGIDPDALAGKPAREYTPDNAYKRWVETWAAGQSLYAVNAIEPVAAVVDALERDYRAAVARFRACAPASSVAR
jgi:nitronate monooxygenase